MRVFTLEYIIIRSSSDNTVQCKILGNLVGIDFNEIFIFLSNLFINFFISFSSNNYPGSIRVLPLLKWH